MSAEQAFLDEFRKKAELYIDENGERGGLRSGELGTLAFAFVVMLAISVAVPLVICVIVGRVVEPNGDLAFTVASSIVLALVGVAAFDFNKRQELRYRPFLKDKRLKGLVRDMCASEPYADTVKRGGLGRLARERLDRATHRSKVLGRWWKACFFLFVTVLSFGIALEPELLGFRLTVYWAVVPLVAFALFEAANCANERHGSFYGLAVTIL